MPRKINEHDCVVLTRDLPEEDLRAGNVGAVIHVYNGGSAYEVEFVRQKGRTVVIATVEAKNIRKVPAA